MLLGNYGRDQMGESSFADQHHQITPGLLHPSIIHQQADVSSQSASSSLTADRNGLKPSPPPDHQMLGRSAGAGGAGGGSSQQQQQEQQRRLKPHSDQVLKCPRCESMNTKFCYYNNYSLTQPRHFCKNCKRYWTKGGALRNVPVGGGCRKNKRVKQRSHQDQQQAPSSSAATSDDQAAAAAATGGGGGLGNHDGASSSGILAQQQEFNPATSSGGIYDHHPIKVSNGMASSLPFDRVDLPLRNIFPGGSGGGGGGGNPPPISINWAGQLHQQPFESSSSILGLNLSAAIKQEPIHPPEINSMFHDPSSLAMAGAMNHHHHHHPHGLSSYVSMDNFGGSAGNPGEILWRFPQQPKLVSLLEDGNEHDHELEAGSRGLLDLEIGADKMMMKQQLIKKSMSRDLDLHQQQPQVSSDYEQGESASSPDQWQPNSSATDGFFDSSGGQGGETQGFWSNGGGWSSADLHHSYGASQTTGNHHQLL